jgi:IrrE N-terminal-like domain
MLNVDSATNRLIKSHQQEAPVEVVRIAQGLGLEVWEDELPVGISGKIFSDPENGGSSGFSITINSTEPPVRKRFTVAHEIAHFILHRDKIGSGIEDDTLYRSKLTNLIEAEANRLAASILMPFPLIESLQRQGINGISELASALQVSQQALKIRLGIPVVD